MVNVVNHRKRFRSLLKVALHNHYLQVSDISSKLAILDEVRQSSDERSSRLKQENAVLYERLHGLEEQLHSVEERWKEKYMDEKQRNKELIHRLEREKTLEVESVGLRYQVLQKEHDSSTNDRQRLTEENSVLKSKFDTLSMQLEDAQGDLKVTEAENAQIKLQLKQLSSQSAADIATSSDLVDELARQNDELRTIKQRGRVGSVVDREADLIEGMRSLREENRQMRITNEELSGQLLQASIETGQSLLHDDGNSLAVEMHGKDKDEIIKSLQDQEMCNKKLRMYIDGILLRVIEQHPEILEKR